MLKTLSFKSFNWVSATRFAVVIQFWQDPNRRRDRICLRENFDVSLKIDFIFKFTDTLALVLPFFDIYIYIYIQSYTIQNLLKITK